MIPALAHCHIPYEADVETGKLCGPDNVAVSGDSDLLIYEKVHEVWRSWSHRRFLQYHINDILKTLDLCQVQCANLGIASVNDYYVRVCTNRK